MEDSTRRSNVSLFGALKDLSFSEFITLKLIKFIYIFGLLGIAISALLFVRVGFSQGFLAGLGAIVITAVGVLFAVLLLRVYLEILAVFFSIASNTTKIAENTSRGVIGNSAQQ